MTLTHIFVGSNPTTAANDHTGRLCIELVAILSGTPVFIWKNGRVWLIAAVLKTVDDASRPWVRILLLPPDK